VAALRLEVPRPIPRRRSTSWNEIDDENGSVAVEATAPVRPEPLGGAVFARVIHAPGRVTVGVLDLTGSARGRWSDPTEKGVVSSVKVRVLLDHPDNGHAEAAIFGGATDRLTPIAATKVPHRQGHALEIDLPVEDGWSVLRITT
jgi:hypothetical protein